MFSVIYIFILCNVQIDTVNFSDWKESRHESKLVHLSLKEYSLHVKTTIRIRNMLETYLGEKRKVMPIFLERVMDAIIAM